VTGERAPLDPLLRSEEELRVGNEVVVSGEVRTTTEVDVEHVAELVERGVEHADVERAPVAPEEAEGDDGQVWHLPDGSISIPVLEEDKATVTEQVVVEADLRKERVEVEVDPDVADRVR
jgi:hypothetical protein